MRGVRFLAVCLAGGWALVPSGRGADSAAATNQLVEVKGRVVPIPGGTNLQFRAESGSTYKLLGSRDAKALFVDTNLHDRILIAKGKIHDSGLEVIGNLHEARKGTIYELYYYCDICSIETSFPGPCLCCREDVVLRERETKRR